MDTVKLVIALLIAVAAMAAFYIFPEQSALLRVGGLLLGAGVAVGIALQTGEGSQHLGLFSRGTDRSTKGCLANASGDSSNNIDCCNRGYFDFNHFMVTGYVPWLDHWIINGPERLTIDVSQLVRCACIFGV